MLTTKNQVLSKLPRIGANAAARRNEIAQADKGSISAADFRAFDPLSQPEAEFRQDLWESGTLNRMPKYV